MLHRHSPARWPDRRRGPVRRWRRRSRRGQVSAVATILGLLLVVTFVASYLTTTLPNTMGQNELQHDVTVQNQVAQLSALVQKVGVSGKLGALVSGPVSLGSAGAPPFAGQSNSILNATRNGSGTSVTFSVQGPTVYNPPTGFGISKTVGPPSGCSTTSTSLTCAAVNKKYDIKWNFTGANGQPYSVSLGTGGNLVLLNFSTNQSTISISGVSGMPLYIQILGDNDSLSINNNGGGNNPISVNITGSYDTVTSGSFPGGASTVYIQVVGDHDLIYGDPASGGNTFYVSYIGVYDTLALTPGDGSTYYTYFTGFDALNPVSPTCPYGALAHQDTVTGITTSDLTSAGAHLYQTFNNSTADPGNSVHNPSSRWQITNQTVPNMNCPFVTGVSFPVSPTGSAGFIVHLRNTYSPNAEVAYDQGSVIYAQPGGDPIFVVPPRMTISNGVLTIFDPHFINAVGTQAGAATTDVALRLLTTTAIVLPYNGFALVNSSTVTISVTTAYAETWYAYFLSLPAFAPYVTCAGLQNVCTAFYEPNNPLGVVTIAIPASTLTQLTFVRSVFAISTD